MKPIDFAALNEVVLKQEAALQFEHFNSRDAWDLGKLIVEEIFSAGIEMTVCIRKLNGYVMFQYTTDKTALNNQNWMTRKFNTVSVMERSSLGLAVTAQITNEVVLTHGLDVNQYVFCGGGFPIKIKGSGIVAVVTVSNLPHVQDHNFLVRCLSKYLGVDVPEIDVEF